jgi:hypothetical protein
MILATKNMFLVMGFFLLLLCNFLITKQALAVEMVRIPAPKFMPLPLPANQKSALPLAAAPEAKFFPIHQVNTAFPLRNIAKNTVETEISAPAAGAGITSISEKNKLPSPMSKEQAQQILSIFAENK